jgi:hypothetical protein
MVVLKPSDAHFTVILQGYFGWGGRIRTFTILINSEVSYRLDHAPAGERNSAHRLAVNAGRLHRQRTNRGYSQE